MKAEVDKITENGLFLEEDSDPQTWDLDSFDIHFLKPIHCECRFNKIGKNIHAKAHVVTRRLIACSRCLERMEQEAHHDVDLYYCRANLEKYIEPDSDIREHILLNFPMKVLCNSECKGICTGCGANLNREECKCKLESNKC